MKLLRVLLRGLIPGLLLAAAVVVAVLSPLVQTWVAQRLLDRQSGIRGSLDSLTARFGKVEADNVQLTIGGAVLKVPSLHAELPVTTAVVSRHLHFRRLVAKGWTLDLSKPAPPPGPAATPDTTAPAPAPPAETTAPAAAAGAPETAATPAPADATAVRDAIRALLAAVGKWSLPYEMTLDGVDLEGDVLVPQRGGGQPVPVRVLVNGGGLAVGREGSFAVDVTTDMLDTGDTVLSLAGHGRLFVTMKTPRTPARIAVKADLSAEGGRFPNKLELATDAAVTFGAGEEDYAFDFKRGDRHVGTFAVRYPEATGRPEGTWKLDLQDSDLAAVAAGRALPRFAVAGDGRFDLDAALTAAHALGRLRGTVSRLEVVSPALGHLGPAAVDADFDLSRDRELLRIDRLVLALTGNGPAVTVQALQPIAVDPAAGGLKPLKPADDWLDVSVRGIPLAWLADVTDALTFPQGEATGEFIVRKDKDAFAVRAKAPVRATGVTLARADRTLGRGLDLTFPLVAEFGADAWDFEAAPLQLASGRAELAELQIKASRAAGAGQTARLGGRWSANLQAPGFKDALPDLGWLGGRTAAGDFTATLGATTELDSKLRIEGRDEHHVVTGTVHATIDDTGRLTFLAPVKIAVGDGVSDLSVEGTLLPAEATPFLALKLEGNEADLDHLRRLTGVAALAGGWQLAAAIGSAPAPGARDRSPFWGDWAGRIVFAFKHLKAGTLAFTDVGGAVEVDRQAVRLTNGMGVFGGHRFNDIVGSVAFDVAAATPYSLKATGSLEPIEIGGFFPGAGRDEPPVLEGKFSVAATVTGSGANLPDLVRRTQEEFRLASSAGIIRLFKTDVDEAIPPDRESAASDTLGRMGTAVGSFFGVEDADRTARKKVNPSLQAALNLINQTAEIGIDQAALTAVRDADGTIRITDLAVTAGDDRFAGTGRIGWQPGAAIKAQPLHLELQFGARGYTAKLLAAAGLVSAPPDASGYAVLSQPVVFSGTVGHIDNRAWHELLVASAKRPPPETPKKAPEAKR